LSTTARAPSGGDSRARTEIVDRARQQWLGKLIDLSRRNNLLYFRTLKTGTLELTGASPEQMARLLSGETVPLSKLVPADREFAVSAVRDIARRALSNAEEKGLQTLFVAVGMATWPADDEGRAFEAPVLLVPITVTAHGRGAESFSLACSGAIQINLVLLHVLEQYGVHVAADELITYLLGDDEGEAFDPQPLFQGLSKRVGTQIKEFSIRPNSFLGNFAFQKMAMVKDLQERGAELAAHELIAAMSGDKSARAELGSASVDVDPKELDRVPPDNEFLVLDADSSQQAAIASIAKGENAVVHGPPGTGKSQTIVNLIATLAAAGKRVLFVAEKRAALEVVQRRLKDVGLDHLAIDLHGADVAPKRVMEQIARALEKVRNSVPVDCTQVHGRVTDRRTRLNAHVARMHSIRLPAEKSVYQLQGLLLSLSRTAQVKTRWRGADLARLSAPEIAKARDFLKEACGFSTLFLRTDPSPWTGASLPDGAAVQAALDLVAHMHSASLAAFLVAVQAITKLIGMAAGQTAKELRAALTLVDETQATLCAFDEELYRRDLKQLASQLARGAAGGLSYVWATLTSPVFRNARKTALHLRRDRKARAATLYQEISSASDQLDRWNKLNLAGLPCSIPQYEELKGSLDAFWSDYDRLKPFLLRIWMG